MCDDFFISNGRQEWCTHFLRTFEKVIITTTNTIRGLSWLLVRPEPTICSGNRPNLTTTSLMTRTIPLAWLPLTWTTVPYLSSQSLHFHFICVIIIVLVHLFSFQLLQYLLLFLIALPFPLVSPAVWLLPSFSCSAEPLQSYG